MEFPADRAVSAGSAFVPLPATMDGKTYYIETYGCQMNEYDSALVEGLLETQGYSKSAHPEGADVVLVNTCSVREKAEDTAYEKLRNLQALKKARPGMKLGMIGCMAENKRE